MAPTLNVGAIFHILLLTIANGGGYFRLEIEISSPTVRDLRAKVGMIWVEIVSIASQMKNGLDPQKISLTALASIFC
jgi:hypothetical protein